MSLFLLRYPHRGRVYVADEEESAGVTKTGKAAYRCDEISHLIRSSDS